VNAPEVQTARDLLAMDGITVVGVLLSVIAGLIWSLKTEFFVLGSQYRDVKRERDDYKALVFAQANVTRSAVEATKAVVFVGREA
jgi:sensor c-di-GMP phosphodiesterase-like protein